MSKVLRLTTFAGSRRWARSRSAAGVLFAALLIGGCGGQERQAELPARTPSPVADGVGATPSSEAVAAAPGVTPTAEEVVVSSTVSATEAPAAATAASMATIPSDPVPTFVTASPEETRDTRKQARETPVRSNPARAVPFEAGRVQLGLEEAGRGFEQPLFLTHAADGSGRAFVVQKTGAIRLLDGGETFIDLSDRLTSTGSEQGLLGLAFHPRFERNGYFYVNYTDTDGESVVARYTATPDRRRGDPATEVRLLELPDPAENHNGGMLAFGPDGFLYIATGDGGGANDQFGNGQNLGSFLAKILRVDVDRGDPYSIPRDNPYAGSDEARPETWAYGLRNPWRFSFDRQTGDLYIGDVGQNAWEYAHFEPAGDKGGRNYGWSIVEGSHCFQVADCDKEGLTLPIAEYSHDVGCSITGGYVYRGERHPALQGAYLFADYCSGRIWTSARDSSGKWVTTEMMRSNAKISSFGEDEAGEVYVTDIDSGDIYQVTARRR